MQYITLQLYVFKFKQIEPAQTHQLILSVSLAIIAIITIKHTTISSLLFSVTTDEVKKRTVKQFSEFLGSLGYMYEKLKCYKSLESGGSASYGVCTCVCVQSYLFYISGISLSVKSDLGIYGNKKMASKV